MVKRVTRLKRRRLTAYKLVELLTGEISYPVLGYDGYGEGHPNPGGSDLAENFIRADRPCPASRGRDARYMALDMPEIGEVLSGRTA